MVALTPASNTEKTRLPMLRLRYLILLVIVVYLLTGINQVRPEERGVVRRFGQVVARPGPGLWVGLPWGIDRIDRVPVRTARSNSLLAATSKTGPILPAHHPASFSRAITTS